MHASRRILAPLVAGALALASSARAQAQCELSGTVVNKDGAPTPNLAVDVLGPTTVYTETDPSGRFTVRLRDGTYVVRFRDGARRAEFQQQVGPCTGQSTTRLDATFRLNW